MRCLFIGLSLVGFLIAMPALAQPDQMPCAGGSCAPPEQPIIYVPDNGYGCWYGQLPFGYSCWGPGLPYGYSAWGRMIPLGCPAGCGQLPLVPPSAVGLPLTPLPEPGK